MLGAGCGEVDVHAVEGSWSRPSVDIALIDIERGLRLMPLYAALQADERIRLGGPLRLAVEAYADAGGAVLIRSTANIAVGRKLD